MPESHFSATISLYLSERTLKLMFSDLLKILQSLQSAQTAEEKTRLERELQDAVEMDIHALFDDLKYSKRRRSFGAIQQSLGIFDEDPETLKKILFNMGARPKSGIEDKALWELKKRNRSGGNSPQSPRISFSTILKVLAAFAAVVAILAYLNISPKDILEFFWTDPPFDLTKCLNEAKQPLELDECHKTAP